MPVTVFMNEMGMIVVANPQGDILTEGFFRTEEETDEALEAMGYQRLLTVYPAAEIVVGTGLDPDCQGLRSRPATGDRRRSGRLSH